jgi:hypothetical protein
MPRGLRDGSLWPYSQLSGPYNDLIYRGCLRVANFLVLLDSVYATLPLLSANVVSTTSKETSFIYFYLVVALSCFSSTLF